MVDELIEAVPNFSEGRDAQVVDELSDAVRAAGAILLDRTSDLDHNRTVLTFCGDAASVLRAALGAAEVAVRRINLLTHRGEHPRMGALDVLPFVPLRNVTLSDCVKLAREAGLAIWEQLNVPVYFYEAAALSAERVRLENVRRGGFESPRILPDLGMPFHPTAGASIVGARKFLIAYNINLQTPDIAIAQQIARQVRASSGGLPHVKALGLLLASRGQAQVSMNLTDFEVTPLHLVFETVDRLARELGTSVASSELIGLVPQAAIDMAAGVDLRWENFDESMILENRIARAIKSS
jgi:glutamate formiminotransferase